MAETADRATFIRESMRRSWSGRTHDYAQEAAPQTAAYARRLMEKMHLLPGERVLDVATGPGVVAVQAAAAVGPGGHVLATDLTPEWAELVEQRCAAAGVANVAFRAMGAESLALPDQSFDVALCQFGLMFVPDPPQALRELRRVLRDGGRLGVVVWSTAEKVPHFSVLNRHLMPLLPPVPPERQLPSPLSLGEPGLVERHVAAAGFRDVAVSREMLDFTVDTAEKLWQGRVLAGPPEVRAAVARLSADEQTRLHDAVMADLKQYERDGVIKLPSEAIYVTAVR